jgi:hypothetical protein
MDFQEAESKYFELKGRLNSGKLTPEQFRAEVSELRIQDDDGRYWTVDARTGGWLLYDGTKWVPAQPPGSVSVPPAPPAPSYPERKRGPSRALLIGALALAAILCVVALGGAAVILSRSSVGGGGEVEQPAAISQQEAERIADDLIEQEFPDMEGAEKTLGSFQNPAGTRFWTFTYRQDGQAQFDGGTYIIPHVLIVSVDQQTGEPVAAASG